MNDLLNIPKPTVSGELYSIGAATSVDFTRLQYALSTGLVDQALEALGMTKETANMAQVRDWITATAQVRHVTYYSQDQTKQSWCVTTGKQRRRRGARGRKRALMEVLP